MQVTAVPIGPRGRAAVCELPDHPSGCPWCEFGWKGGWQSGSAMRDLPLPAAPVWRRRTPAAPAVVEVWG